MRPRRVSGLLFLLFAASLSAASPARAWTRTVVQSARATVEVERDATLHILLRLDVEVCVRALRNLIDNAQRYGRNPVLSWDVSDAGVEIRVDDCGPGIPDNRIRDVFQPYQRIEQSRSLDTGGHGLGLSIARSIVLEHGGTIDLSNRDAGGLRARVVLPLTGTSDVGERLDRGFDDPLQVPGHGT